MRCDEIKCGVKFRVCDRKAIEFELKKIFLSLE